MDRAGSVDWRARTPLILAAALLVVLWRTALAGVVLEHPPTNGTDGGGERAEAWAPGDWQRLLRGCDKFVDSTWWNGSSAAVRITDSSRLRLQHPFLSLAEGVVPDVTYSGESTSKCFIIDSKCVVNSCHSKIH